jgi:IS5 family transposase
MRQRTFSSVGFEIYSKQTRRQRFLTEMDAIVPWRKLCRLIEPHYPRGNRGRPPIGIDRMLRIYFLQVWFNLSDPGVEDALYDSAAMRGFVDIDLGREPAPDETTICKFRHLIEANGLREILFEAVNAHLSAKGIKVGTGSIMDATIIAAPSSTKNEDGKRDPEMHQTKKGNQWYFGLKAHIGVDSNAKIVHSVAATAANVHDSRVIDDILHGNETRVWGDSAYQGQREAILTAAPHAQDFTHHRGNRASALSDVEVSKNRTKSRVRAYVEHPFRVLKCVLGFRKVCCRGIAKNLNPLQVSFALVNLYMKRRTLMRCVRA